MRVVSLLPSLTEIVHALGRGADLVGVTHECDYPPGVDRLPRLTRSAIPQDAPSALIDQMVAAQGGSLYELDADLLDRLRPDLILTQEQCDVCAVNEATVRRAASTISGVPTVESVNPTDLAGVFDVFRRVGALLGADREADALVAAFEQTAAEIARRLAAADAPSRKTILLEWLDPPYASGHWIPEIIARAGGTEPVAQAGAASRRLSWEEIVAADPDVILMSPCGFTLERAGQELASLNAVSAWAGLRAVRDGNVVLVDGSAYFSRPGPRLETSLRIAAEAIHPGLFTGVAPAEGDGWRRLPNPGVVTAGRGS